MRKEYVYGGATLVTIEPTAVNSNGTQYSTSDNLGSPRVITNSSAGVVSRHDYMPFGTELGAGTGGRTTGMGFSNGGDTNRKKFTGYERDNETGLDFAQARYYSNTQGRFSSPDPLMASATAADPQTLNRYGYVVNNPLKFVDPSGMIMGKRKDGEIGDISVLDGTQYNRGTMYGFTESDVVEYEAAQQHQKQQQQQAEEECGCTLRVRGKAGAKLSRGNPLRFPGTRNQRLGPASASYYWGWKIEESGTVSDDVSTWKVSREREEAYSVTYADGSGFSGRSTGSEEANRVYQPNGGHRFYSLDAPGFEKLQLLAQNIVSATNTINFTTRLEEGDLRREVKWSVTITVASGRMVGDFKPHHVSLRP